MSNNTKPVKSSGWIINLSAFIAVIFIGVSLIFTKFGFSGKVTNALNDIAQAISYLILIVISGFYARKRMNLILWALWIVSVVLIVLYFII